MEGFHEKNKGKGLWFLMKSLSFTGFQLLETEKRMTYSRYDRGLRRVDPFRRWLSAWRAAEVIQANEGD